LHALPDVGSALDACAAPGGKSFILLKHYAHLKLTCADVDEARLATLMSNLAPIKSPIPVCFWIKDALSPTPKPHRLTYDLVLLDAPCSGSGVMKRHPEKKYQPWRLGPLVEVQKKLLETLWESVTPGGHLLYATCSILPEENEKIIDAFLSEHANGAALVDVALPIGFKCKSGWQILPSSSHDGHYFALIKKN
jgi:16S rRNA (cytosine967-C5)-methyltransferase